MKKPLLVFVVIFGIAIWLYGSHLTKSIILHAAIAKAPAYAMAIPVGIVAEKGKHGRYYFVRYSYQVDGATYKIHSGILGEKMAKELLSMPPMEVAYAPEAPAKALMRRDFDARDKEESVVSALLEASVYALVTSFIVSLILSAMCGWLGLGTE